MVWKMSLLSNSAILGIHIKFFPLEKETHLQTTNSLGSILVFRGLLAGPIKGKWWFSDSLVRPAISCRGGIGWRAP